MPPTRQCLQSGLTMIKWVTMRIRYGKRQQTVGAQQANSQQPTGNGQWTTDSRQQPALEPMLRVCRKLGIHANVAATSTEGD